MDKAITDNEVTISPRHALVLLELFNRIGKLPLGFAEAREVGEIQQILVGIANKEKHTWQQGQNSGMKSGAGSGKVPQPSSPTTT